MKVAIVDYDGTLFTKETIPFLLGMAKKKSVPAKDYYKALVKVYICLLKYKVSRRENYDKEKFHKEIATSFLSIYQGMTKEQIEEFFRETVIEAEKYFNQKLLAQLRELKEKDYKIILLSGGFLPYVEKVAQKLEFDYVFATELEYLEKGFNLKENLLFITGKRKKETIEKYFPKELQVDWQASYAFADSYFDSDVLELTGNPHAVNPDERLRKYALDKNWPIIEES